MINEPCNSSGELAVGTTVVLGTPGLFYHVVIHPGSAACSVKVYDNATAGSGTVLLEMLGVANGASVPSSLVAPIMANKGITAVVAGTGAVAHVLFSKSY